MPQQEGEAKLPISSCELALVPMPGASSEMVPCQMGPSGAQKQDRKERKTLKFRELYYHLESCGWQGKGDLWVLDIYHQYRLANLAASLH